MIRVKNSYQIDKVFAAIICVILLSLLLNGACSLLKKRVLSYALYFLREGDQMKKLWLLLPLLFFYPLVALQRKQVANKKRRI